MKNIDNSTKTNTQLRIISALSMLAVVIVSILLGKNVSVVVIGLVGGAVVYEFLVNFLSIKKSGSAFKLIFLTYFLFFSLAMISISSLSGISIVINAAGIIFNCLLATFLFYRGLSHTQLINFLRKNLIIIPIGILLLILNLALVIIENDQWVRIFFGLFLLNFGVDTFAWFFGKKFGRTKLWPSVSPKKTVEGLIGGVISSVILTAIYWEVFISEVSIGFFLSLTVIGCCAQLGDLIQSKIKRYFNVKDSSNLIPGHGGVYDRVDSLLYVAPLYASVIKLLG